MNPILQDILAFLYDRRQFKEIRLGKSGEGRRRVEFVFTNGSSEAREYECDQPTFLEWWESAEGHLRSTAEAFRHVAEGS